MRRCCCGDGGCPCGSFSFDFEVYQQGGIGGTERSVQTKASICSMLYDVDDEGTSVSRLIGDVTFVCTTLEGFQYDSGNAQYDPNMDMNGAVGYRWERPPTYTLGRCDPDPIECCQYCETERVLDWVVQNDQSSVTGGSVSVYSSLPSDLQSCFPALPVTPANGIYRVVKLILYVDAERALRETITNTSYNGGSCPPDSVTTGNFGNVPPGYLYVGFVWDTSGMCVEGDFVGAFGWDFGTGACVAAYPYDNDACSTVVTDYSCSLLAEGCEECCEGSQNSIDYLKSYERVSEACFFNSADANATNWTTT